MPWKKIFHELSFLPNLISLFRWFICAPFVIFLTVTADYPSAFLWYVIGAASDWADGWVAREFDLVTDTGKGLDPLADKFLYIGTISTLIFSANSLPSKYMLAAFIALCLSEAWLICIGIRSFRFIGKTSLRGANRSGKNKAIMEIIFTLLFFGSIFNDTVNTSSTTLTVLLTLAVIFAALSIWGHRRDFIATY